MEANTRERILEAALDAFSRKGYDAVGIQEIVSAAGISKPSLYYYFESKIGLLDALLNEKGAVLLQLFEKECRYTHDITASLMSLAGGMFAACGEHPAFSRFLLALTWHPLESDTYTVVRTFQKRLFGNLESLFIAAEQDHGNMRGRAHQYATSFLGLLQTYAGMLIEGHVEFSDDLAYRVVHQYMHGIFS